MTPPRVRPPHSADERTQLTGWLELQRSIVHWKCTGLSETDAHRALIPTSPLMTPAGIVSHLRWVEHLWFEVVLMGRPAEGPQFVEPEDSDMRVDGVPIAQLLSEYTAQCAESDAIIATHSLEDVGRHPDFGDSKANLRWLLNHMIEETSRHAGHLDLIREMIDGETGYY